VRAQRVGADGDQLAVLVGVSSRGDHRDRGGHPVPVDLAAGGGPHADHVDLLGERRRTVNLPSGATIADALNELANDVPAITCRAPHVSFALNEAFVPADTPLSDGDELALIPPVSGG